MNWAQFKDPVSHMCLAGTVVASWSLTQEVAGSSPFITRQIFLSLNPVKTFRKNAIDLHFDFTLLMPGIPGFIIQFGIMMK